ncbi:MAG: putative toxin-antitoxin system toxin component, PIN family [Anaerolineales bacterium]|nr:putative toxin-antitoxin system toxin component, PIN family [Anaerolineales bacterium]
MRVVVDTGILVRALISPKGTIGRVLHALRDGRFTAIYFTPMMLEVADVLGRPKIREKYHIQPNDAEALINLVRLRGELVIPKRTVTACRDPKDNKFLEAALAGEADAVVTGDDDLLVLHPFESMDILRPAELLEKL